MNPFIVSQTVPPKARILRCCAGVVLCLAVCGCYETTQEFTLNPDGSGKMRVESVFVNRNIFDDNRPLPEILKSAARNLLESTKGVEAWRDVSYTNLDDGRFSFRGTAYFRDLSQVEMPNYAALAFAWRKLGDNKMELILREHAQPSEPQDTKSTSRSDELAERLKRERANYQKWKPVLGAALSGARHEVTFDLPGQVESYNNLESRPDGRLAAGIRLTDVLKAMEHLMMDDEWLQRHIASNAKPLQGLPGLNKDVTDLVFSNARPMHVVIRHATEPRFSYEEELAIASKETARLRLSLGLSEVPPLPVAPGGALRNIQVVGIRSVADLRGAGGSPEKPWQSFQPFHQPAGIGLALLAELPGTLVASIEGGEVTTAVAEDGSNLLFEGGFTRTVRARLAVDKSRILLELNLRQAKGADPVLARLAGQVSCTVAKGTREVELGISELVARAKGTALGAQIRSLHRSLGQPGSQLLLHLEVPPEKLLAVWSIQDGVRTKLERKGHTGGSGSYDYMLQSPLPLAAGMTLSVTVFEGFEKHKLPFEITQLRLPTLADPEQ